MGIWEKVAVWGREEKGQLWGLGEEKYLGIHGVDILTANNRMIFHDRTHH